MTHIDDLHVRLQKACSVAGASLFDVPGHAGLWTVRFRNPAAEPLQIRFDAAADALVFSCSMSVPPGIDLTAVPPPGTPSYADMIAAALTAVDPLIRCETGPGRMAITMTVHMDGFSVQEAARACSALERAPLAAGAAIAGLRDLLAQADAMDRAMADFRRLAAADEAQSPPSPPVASAAPVMRPLPPAAPAPPPRPAPPTAATRRLCSNPQCGRELDEAAAFCPACGSRAPAPQPASVRRCPQCGEAVTGGNRFCVVCGTRLA